jgi:hypothetical protein
MTKKLEFGEFNCSFYNHNPKIVQVIIALAQSYLTLYEPLVLTVYMNLMQ